MSRRGRGWITLSAGVTALFAVGALFTYFEFGWNWVSIGLAAAAVIVGLGSIVENLIAWQKNKNGGTA